MAKQSKEAQDLARRVRSKVRQKWGGKPGPFEEQPDLPPGWEPGPGDIPSMEPPVSMSEPQPVPRNILREVVRMAKLGDYEEWRLVFRINDVEFATHFRVSGVQLAMFRGPKGEMIFREMLNRAVQAAMDGVREGVKADLADFLQNEAHKVLPGGSQNW